MVESIVRAGTSAATSSNLQGTTVIRVRNPDTRDAIATLAGGQSYVSTAAVFLVWCADLHRSALACEMGGGTLSAGMTEHFMIATIDVALAAQNAVVAAESLGLGICYIGGIRNDPQQVADLLRLPDQVYPVFGMCLGWPDQDPAKKPRLPLSVTLKEESYDDSQDREGIGQYDQQMREYYRERTGGKVDRVWSEDMSALLGKESRPHMRQVSRRPRLYHAVGRQTTRGIGPTAGLPLSLPGMPPGGSTAQEAFPNGWLFVHALVDQELIRREILGMIQKSRAAVHTTFRHGPCRWRCSSAPWAPVHLRRQLASSER